MSPAQAMENPEDAEYSHTQLATLLADSYKDIDTLRRELVLVRKRADKAERMLLNFQTIQQSAADVTASSGPSPDVARMLMELEDRASRAERARDEAEARRRAVHDNWLALERYLSSVDVRTHDARSHFGRMLSGDSSPLSLPAPSPYAPPVVGLPLLLFMIILLNDSSSPLRMPFRLSRPIPIPIPADDPGRLVWMRRFNNRHTSDREARRTDGIPTQYVIFIYLQTMDSQTVRRIIRRATTSTDFDGSHG